jgi:hypothetical protein
MSIRRSGLPCPDRLTMRNTCRLILDWRKWLTCRNCGANPQPFSLAQTHDIQLPLKQPRSGFTLPIAIKPRYLLSKSPFNICKGRGSINRSTSSCTRLRQTEWPAEQGELRKRPTSPTAAPACHASSSSSDESNTLDGQ